MLISFQLAQNETNNSSLDKALEYFTVTLLLCFIHVTFLKILHFSGQDKVGILVVYITPLYANTCGHISISNRLENACLCRQNRLKCMEGLKYYSGDVPRSEEN